MSSISSGERRLRRGGDAKRYRILAKGSGEASGGETYEGSNGGFITKGSGEGSDRGFMRGFRHRVS